MGVHVADSQEERRLRVVVQDDVHSLVGEELLRVLKPGVPDEALVGRFCFFH